MKRESFIFAYIPKVACTNWKCIFRYMIGNTDYLNAVIAHNRQLSGFEFLSDREDREKLLEDEHIKKYCFVRNPYSRILSAYLNKIEPFTSEHQPKEHNPHFYSMYEDIDKFRLENMPNEPIVNFFVFLKWVHTSNHIHALNGHWMPQVDLLHLKTTNYNFMGKFENIRNDAHHLLSLINCGLKFPTQEKVRFPPTKATEKVKQYYSIREIQVVKSLYSRDFELLNYSDSPENNGL